MKVSGKELNSSGELSALHLRAVAAKRSHDSRRGIIIHAEMDPANRLFAHLASSLGGL
jgi:hypothetical protein